MTPQAPCTITCIRKAPTASQMTLAAKAHSGSTTSDSNEAMMIMRRRPKRSDSAPNDRPPMMAPIL